VADGKYDLILQGAQLADELGLTAIWTPERHFGRFGGLYPNPAVLGAAIAARTRRISIRAGSVVLPLHHPVRVVEEWSVVDNLSGGRVGLAMATGWDRAAFVLNPGAYADRHQRLETDIGLIRRLWTGESASFPGVDGAHVDLSTYPRPIQKVLPLWLTAGSPEAWRRAAQLDANVLCRLGPSVTQLAAHVAAYREARTRSGYDAADGIVTVMVHAYVHPDIDEAKSAVRAPMMDYLKEHLALRMSDAGGGPDRQITQRAQEFLDAGFEQRFRDSLIGPQPKCRALLQQLQKAGANEVACLVDFGLCQEAVLGGVVRLGQLQASLSA